MLNCQSLLTLARVAEAGTRMASGKCNTTIIGLAAAVADQATSEVIGAVVVEDIAAIVKAEVGAVGAASEVTANVGDVAAVVEVKGVDIVAVGDAEAVAIMALVVSVAPVLVPTGAALLLPPRSARMRQTLVGECA